MPPHKTMALSTDYFRRPQNAEIEDRDELFTAVGAFLRCCTGAPINGQPNPLILFIDDAQWSDPASLELLAHLLSNQRDAPLLVVMTTR